MMQPQRPALVPYHLDAKLQSRVTMLSGEKTAGAENKGLHAYLVIGNCWASVTSTGQGDETHEIETQFSSLYGGAGQILFGSRLFEILERQRPNSGSPNIIFSVRDTTIKRP